jgi:hypothetical protein
VDVVIAALATRHHGVVSYQQLLDAGLGRGAIAHRVRAGLLHRLHRGVFGVGYRPVTREARWMAAVLAYGARAALSHTSALALWDLRPSADSKIDVTVMTRNGLAARDGIRLRRCATTSGGQVTVHRAIRVTTIARTLLDGAAILTPAAIARTVERAEIRGLFDLTAVQHTLDLHPTHRGARRLATAIDLFRDTEISRSELEVRFLALCDARGLPRPLVNHIVEGEEVDFSWPDRRLLVETDGRETHLTPQAFERDRAKDAALTVAGYRVVRFTYRQVVHDPAAVGATLASLLRQHGATTARR